MREVIWVVVNTARDKEFYKSTYIDRRIRMMVRYGVDMMYINRFGDARRYLNKGDRVVLHLGSPKKPGTWAQHLVAAGWVAGKARPLQPQDVSLYPDLWELTGKMFPKFPQSPADIEGEGLIPYDLYHCDAQGVPPLPRASSNGKVEYPQPRQGNNFIPLWSGDASYDKVNKWWHRVVPAGQVVNQD